MFGCGDIARMSKSLVVVPPAGASLVAIILLAQCTSAPDGGVQSAGDSGRNDSSGSMADGSGDSGRKDSSGSRADTPDGSGRKDSSGNADVVDAPSHTSGSPVVFFTDLTSGPNTGGEGNNGAYLTIYGGHFGSSRGNSAVTINGAPVAQYILWSETKIGLQVGHVSSGPIVVTVDGHASNATETFTARAGNIYYIGSAVDDSAPGSCSTLLAGNSYQTPWGLTDFVSTTMSDYNPSTMRTPYTYYSCISPGDTLVFLDGVNYRYFDGSGWSVSLRIDKVTTSSSFITLQARPAATATLGGGESAIVGIGNTGSSTYTVYSGLTLVGQGADGAGLSTSISLHAR